MRRRQNEKKVLRQVVTDALEAKFNPKEIAAYFGRERTFVYRLVSMRELKAKKKLFYP